MPTRRFTKSMVAAAILGYEEQKRQINVEIAELKAEDECRHQKSDGPGSAEEMGCEEGGI